MPTTPVYALPYPLPTDPADGPAAFENLAEAVEASLGGPPVSALPSVPQDGQLVRYKVGANGPVWTFQYLAASTAPKWHFVGGAPMSSFILANEGVAGNTPNQWLDCTTVGPAITLPLAGDYRVDGGANAAMTTATAQRSFIGVAYGAGTPAYPCALELATAGHQGRLQQCLIISGASAGSELRMRYQQGNPGGTFSTRSLLVTPVRVA